MQSATQFLFEVCGPFDVYRLNGAYGQPPEDWWRVNVDAHVEDLSSAIGCYMYALATPRESTPWYVGRTSNRFGFSGEVFAAHKCEKYQRISAKFPNEEPHLFFFPLMQRIGENASYSYARRTARRAIEWLERRLMAMAYAANKHVENIQELSLERSVSVNGLLGDQAGWTHHDGVTEARIALKL